MDRPLRWCRVSEHKSFPAASTGNCYVCRFFGLIDCRFRFIQISILFVVKLKWSTDFSCLRQLGAPSHIYISVRTRGSPSRYRFVRFVMSCLYAEEWALILTGLGIQGGINLGYVEHPSLRGNFVFARASWSQNWGQAKWRTMISYSKNQHEINVVKEDNVKSLLFWGLLLST